MADATGKLYWYKLLIAEDTREGAVPVANISTMYDLLITIAQSTGIPYTSLINRCKTGRDKAKREAAHKHT
jgi:hypothetical protein